jgi:hypothetical protein
MILESKSFNDSKLFIFSHSEKNPQSLNTLKRSSYLLLILQFIYCILIGENHEALIYQAFSIYHLTRITAI